MIAVLSLVLTVLAMIGTAYTAWCRGGGGAVGKPHCAPAKAGALGRRRCAQPRNAPAFAGARRFPSITMLKPLHGPEPMLEAKLAGFLEQDYPGPIDMVCGVADAADPALDAARAVQAKLTKLTATASFARHGTNGKVSNLINMLPAAKGDILILSDSDMIVGPDYAAS